MSGPHFQLHPQLARDTFPVAALTLSELLLMNDSRFPWCILVPRLPDLTGLHELPVNRRELLFDEISRVSRVLLTEPRVQRINVGALGNIVQQLHIHVVGRRSTDPAWPGPVWGHAGAVSYAEAAAAEMTARLAAALDGHRL